MGLELLVGIMAVVTAWQGLAIIGLTRRILELEGRTTGEQRATTVLSYQPGDRVPANLSVAGLTGSLEALALDHGLWLLVFATEGCTACSRAARAAVAVASAHQDLAVAILLPEQMDSREASWIDESPWDVRRLMYRLFRDDWLSWGPQGTPTCVLVADSRIADVEVGLATKRLVESFLERNSVEPLVSR